MKCRCLVVVPLLFLFSVGCSGEDTEELDTQKPDYYAQKIKTQVNELVETVQGNPRAAVSEGEVLLEELEVYQSQPVGDHEQIYAQLLQACKDLVAAGEQGSRSQVKSKLNEMQNLAAKLPG